MSSLAAATHLPAGHIFDIAFPEFTPRITIRSATELSIEIVAGDYLGTAMTVEYEVMTLRPGLFYLTWQEESQATVVHVEDFAGGKVHTAITYPDGQFQRMTGAIIPAS